MILCIPVLVQDQDVPCYQCCACTVETWQFWRYADPKLEQRFCGAQPSLLLVTSGHTLGWKLIAAALSYSQAARQAWYACNELCTGMRCLCSARDSPSCHFSVSILNRKQVARTACVYGPRPPEMGRAGQRVLLPPALTALPLMKRQKNDEVYWLARRSGARPSWL